jgi:UDP-N-acetylmuramoyl-L-alanyl-D-glutamate--2,6-diaminopimelate ligase
VLYTINNVKTQKQQLISVVGAGGDRDKTKRPIMAKVAVENSDKVILTSDNPRTEPPTDILDDMERGIIGTERKKVLRITDRKEAIKTACLIANDGDIVLIAGKGHEDYQEINGVRHDFDDKQIFMEQMEILNS